MYDAIEALNLPVGGDLYAGYIGGSWPDASAIAQRFPTKTVVRIAVQADENDGVVLDVEKGDATPAQAVDWVLHRRAAHVDPTVYCNTSTWPAVVAAFQARKVGLPHWWAAAYVNDPSKRPTSLPAGAIALQWYDFGRYDASIVADYWPGVDPAPKPPAPTTQLEEEDDMQQIEPLKDHPGEYVYMIPAGSAHIGFGADGYAMAPARLRVVTWNGNAPSVHTPAEFGGSAPLKHNSVPLTAVNGVAVEMVTVRRLDAGEYPIGVYTW